MKITRVLAAIALTLGLVSLSNAASKPIEVAPCVNVALPMGDMSDRSGVGFGAGGSVDFFLMPQGSIGGFVGYTSFSGKSIDSGSVHIDGPSSGVFEINGHFRYYLGKNIAKAFFLEGNLGIHSISDGGGSHVGFAGGVGTRIPMGKSGKTTLVPEALFYDVTGDGGSSQFLMFRLGLAFGVNKSGK